MNDELCFWVVHAVSGSRFAAKNANEALDIINDWNGIALEYGLPPTNMVKVASDAELDFHAMELSRREKEGDLNYFQP